MTEPFNSKRDLVAIGSMCVMVVLVLIRAMSTHEPFPMWDSDPYLFVSPLTGITAGYGILLNTLVMVLSAVILICSPGSGRADSAMRVLLGVGCVWLGVHLVLDPVTMVNGSTLGAMMSAAIASRAFLMARPQWTAVVVPVVLGGGVFLALYGYHQVYVQHPQTVAMYEQSRESFIHARGWTDGSFEVMSYERRLRQPEPTGWFGLANVYASFIAAFGVAAVMVTLCSIRRAWWVLSGLVAGILLAILLVSKSKGGIGAAVLGFGTIQYALARHRGRLSRMGTSTLGACVLVMGGVVGGAMLHQLSLLFRGQYMVGALRIFAEHPVIGVGPGKFQDAYMVHKPSTSPEDVTSAHNLVFDLFAQLGLAGIAWVGLLIVLIWTSRLPNPESLDPASSGGVPRGILVRLIPLMVLVVGVGVIRLQSNAMDLELMLVLLIGVGVWMGASVLLGLFGTLRTLQIAAMSAGVVLMIHAMLDLAPVWVVSGPLFGLCVGFGFRGDPTKRDAKLWQLPNLVAVASLGFVVVITSLASNDMIARDRALIRIASPAMEISQIRLLLASQTPDADLANRAAVLTGSPIKISDTSIKHALDTYELEYRVESATELDALYHQYRSVKLEITALEQMMTTAVMLDDQGRSENSELWEPIERTALQLTRRGFTYTEQKWAGHAYLFLAQHRASSPEVAEQFMAHAFDVWIRADALNPHDPKHAIRLMDLAIELNRPDEAEVWAIQAVERSGRMRLDPLKQLSPETLRRAQELANPD